MQSSMTALCLYGFLISECHRDQGGQLIEGTVASVAPQMARSKVLDRMGLQIPNSSSEEGKYGFRKSPSCILPAPWSPQGCFHVRVSHAHNTEHVQPQVCALRTTFNTPDRPGPVLRHCLLWAWGLLKLGG